MNFIYTTQYITLMDENGTYIYIILVYKPPEMFLCNFFLIFCKSAVVAMQVNDIFKYAKSYF